MKTLSEELQEYADHKATPSGMKLVYGDWAGKARLMEAIIEIAKQAEKERKEPGLSKDHPPHPRRNSLPATP